MLASLQLPTHLGPVDALVFGARGAPLIVALQGKSANLDVITEWEPAAQVLAEDGYCVVVPNLHTNELTKPGTVASADVQRIVRGICDYCGAKSVVIMGKSWGGGEAVLFAAAHAEMVDAVVLVAPSLSDMSKIGEIAKLPTVLFWARDDPVKSFALSAQYTSAISDVTFHAVDSGGHRVLEEYLPILRSAVERMSPGARLVASPSSNTGGGMDAFLIVGGLYIDELHVLPHFPAEDSAIRSISVTRRRGGNAATNACVLAQLVTQPVKWAGPVPANGADGAVDFGLNAMKAYGVDVSLHEKVPDEAEQQALGMPTAVILVSQATGSRTIVSSRRGMREISPMYVRDQILPNLPPTCWLHFEAREFQSVVDIVSQADTSRRTGWRLSIEVEKPSFNVDQLLAFVSCVDVCFISREWAEANAHSLLAGCTLDEHRADVPDASHLAFQVLRALEKRFEVSHPTSANRARRVIWIMAWGALGAFAIECVRSQDGRGVEHDKTKVHFSPAAKLARVVDSTGAGDTFNAAVISALSRGASVDVGEALRVGCHVAGKKVAQDGFDGLGSAVQ